MKHHYLTPAMTVVAMQPACHLLGASDSSFSGTISGYSANTGGGFNQSSGQSNAAKSNEQHFDDWEEWK